MDNDYYETNSDLIAILSQRIKDNRLAARMSQKELSAKSGVSLTAISHLEQGVKQNLTLNNLISILRVFGMEQRLLNVLPELPMPTSALKEINKLKPKRVRRK